MIDAAKWSALAACGSVVAATVSLAVAWRAVRIQGKAADFANCLEVVGQLRDGIRRVQEGETPEKRKFEFIELLNLMEALALLYNDGKIAASTRKITGKFLEQALAGVRADETMKKLMDDTVTGDDTYDELEIFEQRHAANVRKLAKEYVIERGIR